MLLKASSAVTVKLNEFPAVALPGALTVKCVAVVGFTVTFAVPVIVPVMVSVAVTDCSPAVTKVTPLVKVCTPASPPTNV